MASAEPPEASTTEPVDVPSTPHLPRPMDRMPAEPTPVELSTLSRPGEGGAESTNHAATVQNAIPAQAEQTTDNVNASTVLYHSIQPSQTDNAPFQNIQAVPQPPQQEVVETNPHASSPSTADPNPLTRIPTQPAIEPSSDKPTPVLPDSTQTLFITLLLTTGARHPYKIDEKYLQKRNVSVEGNNPLLMSIYTLKELIWREWRDEWEPRPSSPSSIRLIYAGHMPGDNSRLQECKFQPGPTPHVVHMTIKPQEFVDEEEAQKGSNRDREAERSPGCRCCVM